MAAFLIQGRTQAMLDEKTARIAKLNDLLRTTFLGGRVVATCGLNGLPDDEKAKIFAAVRTFDQFDQDNDPYPR